MGIHHGEHGFRPLVRWARKCHWRGSHLSGCCTFTPSFTPAVCRGHHHSHRSCTVNDPILNRNRTGRSQRRGELCTRTAQPPSFTPTHCCECCNGGHSAWPRRPTLLRPHVSPRHSRSIPNRTISHPCCSHTWRRLERTPFTPSAVNPHSLPTVCCEQASYRALPEANHTSLLLTHRAPS